MVGVTQGRIYKISIQQLTEDARESSALFQNALAYLSDQMGAAKNHSRYRARYYWDGPQGNVI